MSTPTPAASMEDIVTTLGRRADAATIEQIEAAMTSPPARRTLQYWLMMLVEQGRVVTDRGATPARYRLSAATGTGQSPVASPPSATPDQRPTVDGATPAPLPPPATPAVTPPAGSPAPVTAPTPAIDANEARYAELFEASVMQIVVALLPKVSWTPYLQNTAMLRLRLPEQRRAYLAYGKARLERLTPEEAELYGIDRSQYDSWRALD